MTLGVISIIIGAIIFIANLLVGIDFGTVNASIFIVGGFIIITIEKSRIKQKENTNSEPKQKATSWKCKICGQPNLPSEINCVNCHNPK